MASNPFNKTGIFSLPIDKTGRTTCFWETGNSTLKPNSLCSYI